MKRSLHHTFTAAALFVFQLLLAQTAFAYAHPGGLHPQSQLDFVKKKVEAGAEPWASAYKALIAKADWLRNEQPGAVKSFYVPSYYADPKGHLQASSSLQNDVKTAYVSAVAYALTSKASYGDKVVTILNDWAYTNTEVGGDDSTLVMTYAGVGLIQSAELVSGYSGWKPEDHRKFNAWVAEVFLAKAANMNIDRTNNWGAWSVYGAISGYRYLDDTANVRKEIDRLKSKIDTEIAADGSVPSETSRDAGGLRYTYFYLAPLTAAAQVAYEAEGVNLFQWVSPHGKTIKSALDFALYYLQNPAKWPYYANPAVPSASESWGYNLYEAMSGYYNDPDYAAFAAKRRPIMETGHHYAWTFPTLLKADADVAGQSGGSAVAKGEDEGSSNSAGDSGETGAGQSVLARNIGAILFQFLQKLMGAS